MERLDESSGALVGGGADVLSSNGGIVEDYMSNIKIMRESRPHFAPGILSNVNVRASNGFSPR